MTTNYAVKERSFAILGRAYLELGDKHKAFKYSEKGGIAAQKELIELAHYFIGENWIYRALEAYMAAEVKFPEDELEKLVERVLSGEDIQGVEEVCIKMGGEEKLAKLAEYFFNKGDVQKAIKCYNGAGKEVPKLGAFQISKLSCQRNWYLRKDDYWMALEINKIMEDKLMFSVISSFCLQKGNLECAMESLMALYGEPLEKKLPETEKDKVADYSKKHLESGYFQEGMKAYKAIGRKAPREALIICGEKLLKPASWEEAALLSPEIFKSGFRALRMAGLTPSKRKIISAGDCYKNMLFYYYAIEAYKKAKAKDRLYEWIKEAVKQKDLKLAKELSEVMAEIED